MQTVEASELTIPEPLLREISSGVGVMVERDHVPIAIILPVQQHDGPRPFGLCQGEFVVPEDFNEPLPEWEAWLNGQR